MKVLFTTNGKNHSIQALEFATRLLKPLKPKATLLFVGKNSERNKKIIDEGIKILKKSSIKAQPKIITTAKVADAIVKETETGDYHLLVLGSRGISKIIPGVSSYILGDIPREVVEKSEISTLYVKEPIELNKVLVAVDKSKAGEEAALFWGRLAKPKQKTTLITIIPELYSQFSDELQLLAEEQLLALSKIPNQYTQHVFRIKQILEKKYRVRSQVQLREGDVINEILKEAEKDYGLIVLGRDERDGNAFDVHLAGIVEQAKIPVLVVRRDAVKKIA